MQKTLDNPRPIHRIGIDVGKVILAAANDGSHTDFVRGPNYLNARTSEHALIAIDQLSHQYGNENIVIISKCRERTELRTLEWMDHNHFYEQTGVLRNNVFFCRNVEDKGPISVRLGLDAFIDDRLAVLFHVREADSGIYQILFGNERRDCKHFSHHLPHVQRAANWHEVLELLL